MRVSWVCNGLVPGFGVKYDHFWMSDECALRYVFLFFSFISLWLYLGGGSEPIFAPSSGEGILSGLRNCTPAAHFLVNLCAPKERLRLLFVARSSHHLAYELCSPVYSSWSSPVFQLSAWSLYPVSQSSLLCSSKMCRIHRLHGPVSPLESTLHSGIKP